MKELTPVVKKSSKDIVKDIPAPASDRRRSSMYVVRTADQCIKDSNLKPVPKKLFGSIFFEGEWTILFADSGVGKSILAVQIADAIASGQNNYKELFPVEVEPQVVLYFDYELSDKQFEKRYSVDYTQPYKFHPNFYRVIINNDNEDIDEFVENVFTGIEDAILEYSAKVVIIDNITALGMFSTDSAKDAMPVIKRLNRLKKKFGVSLLTLHHTPKRDKSLPITDSSLAGSKMFSNFSDSIFAIGVSGKDENTKYIKQIKTRSDSQQYGTENVIICNTEKIYNCLAFTFNGTGSEREHLKELSEQEKAKIDGDILEIIKSNPDKSPTALAKELGVHHSKVIRIGERNGIVFPSKKR